MPYHAQWLLQDKIFYSRAYGVYTGDDLRAFIGEVRVRFKDLPPFVHMINDNRDIEQQTMNLNDIQTIFSTLRERDPVLGWTFNITTNPMWRFFGAVASQTARIRERHMADVESALAFLVAQDDTLPDLATLQAAYHALTKSQPPAP